MEGCPSLSMFPNWAPAFAGVVGLSRYPSPRSLFTREGGCPAWVPAFAGKQSEGLQGSAAQC